MINITYTIKHPQILMIILFVFISSCNLNQPSGEKTRPDKYHKIQQLEWLHGSWANISEEGNYYENWNKVNDSLFRSFSYMSIAGDTVFSESVDLLLRENELYYIVSVGGQNDGQAVSFQLVSGNNGEFIFENKEHDFPQRVIYKNPAPDSLYAKIEGTINGKFSVQEFPMKRIADLNPVE